MNLGRLPFLLSRPIDDLMVVVGPKRCSRYFCKLQAQDRPVQIVGNPIFPVPTSEEIAKTSSVLSVSISLGSISWCWIRRNDDKTSFFVESLAKKSFAYKPKMHFLSVLKEIDNLSAEIPDAELLVVEEFSNTVPTQYMFSFHLQLTQLRSMFLGNIIGKRKTEKIISIKKVAVARLFNTYVGSEQVSGQHLIDDYLIWKPSSLLGMRERDKYYYTSAEPIQKEEMSHVMLLNLAYWKLTKQFV